MSPKHNHFHIPLTCLAVFFTAAICFSACGQGLARDGDSFVEDLAVRLNGVEGYGPRVSMLSTYRLCPGSVLPPGAIPQNPCRSKAISDRSVRRLAVHIARTSRAQADADVLHTSALIDMLSADSVALNRAVAHLDLASRVSNQAAPMLADLAAAHLLRAQYARTSRDLVVAIDAAARALDLEPQNRTARFNMALALHWLGLAKEARAAWEQFLQVDSTSTWADEARSHIDALDAQAAVPPPEAFPAPLPASDSVLAAYVTAAPEVARFVGQDQLGEWARSAMRGDSVRTASLLRQAGVIAGVLERRGGDATLADAVRAIQGQAGDPAETRSLARKYEAFAGGRAALRSHDARRAGRLFREVLFAPGGSEALRQWATLSYAATLSSQKSDGEALQLLQHLITQTDTVRQPALAGSAYSQMGTILLRKGMYDQSKKAYELAARLFERIGEHQQAGMAQLQIAYVQSVSGHSVEAYEWIHQTMETLQPYPGINLVLYRATQLAMDDGLTYAAVWIQSEGVTSASRMGGENEAEARLSRARALCAVGKSAEAVREAQQAEYFVESYDSGKARRKFEADVRAVEAGAVLHDQPLHAAILLDSVVTSSTDSSQLSAALTFRSEARLALGELDSAAIDLHRAAELLDVQQLRPGARLQLKRVQTLYRALVMRYVSADRMRDALTLLERVRTTQIGGEAVESEAERLPLTGPVGQVVVRYLLIGDTLLTWTISGTVIHLTRSTVSREKLSRTVVNARLALELEQRDEALLHLEALYEWLIRPVNIWLGAADTPLVIIADGEIAGIPFAALYDAGRKRYLIQDHPLRAAHSLKEVVQERRSIARGESTVLLVADPAFDARAYPGMGRLSAARAEADSVAAEYPSVNVIEGVDATQPALEAGVRHANLMHFAGHAFIDGEHPDRSFLVLAPLRGQQGMEELTAAEIAETDLHHMRLVVLAACETLHSQGEWPDAPSSLGDAMLNAGAGGVVGSLWRVRDDLTRPLMVQFHRAYKVSGDGGRALRDAQLNLLRSKDPSLRSPAAWAGFQYIGM